MPMKHAAPVSHAWPQAPQFDASPFVFTQLPEQFVAPPVQLTTQRPIEQTCPLAHALPHVPQCSGSSPSEVQIPLHSVSAMPPPGPPPPVA